MANFDYQNKAYLARRQHDVLVERNISKILDALYTENGIIASRNTSNVELQKKGVDVVVEVNGKPVNVDEKSASTYFQKHLHTFAFEIATTNNKNGSGWFDPDNHYIKTEYYMLVYPYAPNKPKNDLLESVDEIETLLIKKSDIWEYLSENGIHSIGDALSFLEQNGFYTDKNCKRVTVDSEKNKKICYVSKDIKIVQSLHLTEKPINIVISRDVLRKLSTKTLSKKYAA